VVVRLADGGEERGDILIGADGIKSVVRQQLHGWTEPHYSGITAWRAICDYESPQIPVGEMCIYWGPGARILHYHVSGQRLYWLSLVKSPPRLRDPEGGSKAAVTERYRGWPRQVEGMLAATDETAILRTDIVDRDPLKRWGQDRVTLLGDAAHPMYPDMAQGAGQAIEDAICLAGTLRRAADPVSALQDYEERRRDRANGFVKTSRIVNRMSLMQAPVMCAVRNQVALRTVYAIQAAGKVRKDLTPAL
jgi:2-polyprenyl-6-methoxyphenol hydroxylase-like FAD-dependent oxidoreductase